MKKLLIPGQFAICSVRHLPTVPTAEKTSTPGMVQATNGDKAVFLFEDSHNCVGGDKWPEFGTGRARFLKVADEIVCFVAPRGKQWVIEGWTHIDDYRKAKAEIEDRSKPKLAPQLPKSVPEIIAAQSKPTETTTVPTSSAAVVPEKKNQTGPDRRRAFKPTPRIQPAPEARVFDLTAELARAAEQVDQSDATARAAS